MKHIALAITLAALGAACRTNPCGDRTGTLPDGFENAPVVVLDGSICDGRGNQATIMYWGDQQRMSEVIVVTLAQMNNAGYEETKGSSAEGSNPHLSFKKGDRYISLVFEQMETPRLGSKLKAPSIFITAFHQQKAASR